MVERAFVTFAGLGLYKVETVTRVTVELRQHWGPSLCSPTDTHLDWGYLFFQLPVLHSAAVLLLHGQEILLDQGICAVVTSVNWKGGNKRRSLAWETILWLGWKHHFQQDFLWHGLRIFLQIGWTNCFLFVTQELFQQNLSALMDLFTGEVGDLILAACTGSIRDGFPSPSFLLLLFFLQA